MFSSVHLVEKTILKKGSEVRIVVTLGRRVSIIIGRRCMEGNSGVTGKI